MEHAVFHTKGLFPSPLSCFLLTQTDVAQVLTEFPIDSGREGWALLMAASELSTEAPCCTSSRETKRTKGKTVQNGSLWAGSGVRPAGCQHQEAAPSWWPGGEPLSPRSWMCGTRVRLPSLWVSEALHVFAVDHEAEGRVF